MSRHPYEEPTSFKRIQQCFVRRNHTCGKYLGASKSCFIACPSDDNIKVLTGLIAEKLAANGIEPIVAVDTRAYGQDIFCTKICGKIIEAQFCIAILDDAVVQGNGKSLSTPNPNVYYEYGLMTALGKYVIPLQKDGQELAFNIKTHDTIRYSPAQVSLEIDKALKAAITTTIEERESQLSAIIPAYMYNSFLAMKGYQLQGYSWLLSDDIEGTVFSGYRNDKTLDYLFFAVVDTKDLLKTCLIDIQVVQRRLNRNCEILADRVLSWERRIAELQSELVAESPSEAVFMLMPPAHRDPDTLKAKRDEESAKLQSIRDSKFAVVLTADLVPLKGKCVTELDGMDVGPIRFPIYFGDTSSITIADIEVQFKAPEL